MEIRIRTHEELRTDRVTIEITGTGAEVTEFAEAKLYTDGEVANLQASEAELVAGPLRRRIAELERALAKETKRAEEAESKLMKGHVCTGGCSGNQHVAFVGRKALTEMENQVAELTRKIGEAQGIIHGSQVQEAMEASVGRMGVAMAKALQDVSNTLA